MELLWISRYAILTLYHHLGGAGVSVDKYLSTLCTQCFQLSSTLKSKINKIFNIAMREEEEEKIYYTQSIADFDAMIFILLRLLNKVESSRNFQTFWEFQVNCDIKCNKFWILLHGLSDLSSVIKFIRDEISLSMLQYHREYLKWANDFGFLDSY